MATSHQIHLSPQDTGLWHTRQTDEAAKKAADLLQDDLKKHHVFFNDKGFHNHIVHHVLSLYGTGAAAAVMQQGYDANTSYQRPALEPHQEVVSDLFQTWEHASSYLGKEDHYPDFLAFFQREIDAKGWEAVLSEYLFKKDSPSADDLLIRLFASFVHPLIQLMYGLEWKQPAIVAEALAQACVHPPDFKDLFVAAERNANETYATASSAQRMPSIVALHEEIRADPTLATAVAKDPAAAEPQFATSFVAQIQDELLRVVSKVKVRPDEVDERTAEMFDAEVYVATSAAMRGPQLGKPAKYDFFLMHLVNAAPFFLSINAQPWIPAETKARLLEIKIRADLLLYTMQAVPSLSLDDIKSYQPANSSHTSSSISDTFSQIFTFAEDDGHAIKLGRAVAICQDLTQKYQDRDWLMIRGDDVWLKIQNLILESVFSPGPTWVKCTGVDQSWDMIPNKSK